MQPSEPGFVMPLLFALSAVALASAFFASREARRLRLQLADAQRRVELVIRATQTGIVDWDVASNRIDYSERFREILGFPLNADLSDRDRYFDGVHPEDRQRARDAFVAHMRENRDRAEETLHPPIEYRLRRADGGYAWVRGTGLSLRGADGRTARYISSIIDITERKRHEIEAANNSKFIQDLIESVPVSISFRDIAGRYQLVNRTWEQYFRSKRGQVIGKTLHELMPAELADPIEAEHRAALERGPGAAAEQFELLLRGRRYLQTRTAMADAAGNTIGLLLSARDITDQHEVQQVLETQRQRLELVLRASQAGIIDWNAVPSKAWYSGRYKELLGFAADADTSGWTFFDRVHPEDYQRVRDAYVAHLKGADPALRDSPQVEYRMRRADGSYVWVHGIGMSLRDESGRSVRFVAAITDISERRRQEEALRTQQQRLSLVIRGAQAGIVDWSADTRITWYSERFKEMLGYPADADTSSWPDFWEMVHPDEREQGRTSHRAYLKGTGVPGQETVHDPLEYRLRRADGTWLWVQGRGVSLRDTAGRAARFIAAITDISERRAQEEALRDQVKLTRDLIDGNPNPVYLKDDQCRFVEINTAYTQLTRVTPEKAKGQTVFDLYQTERAAQFDRQDRELLARGEGSSVIEVDYDFPERKRHFLMSKTILKRADGSVRGLVGTLTDVTELNDIAAQLRASREEALQAAQAKAAFLAAMSHEIRTPLNGVLGMAGLLEGTVLTPEQREYVETIQVSGDALLAVINDILDYSKIESGRMALEREPLEPLRAIEESLEILGARARAKGLELIAETADGLPAWVLGDLARLRQVLVNLVGNAVKFTDAGEVVVAARAPAPGVLEFAVRDTGIGIAKDRVGSLFEAFAQADVSTTRKYGGTGLGLAISRRLVELMGGELRVESEPGRGSTFSFTVRAQACAPLAPALAPPAAADALRGKRLLVVDDNPTNRRILARQLERWGALQAAESSAAAALARLEGDRAFDAALFDYHMPGMDGVMLARELRRRGLKLPIVLLSSSMYRRAEEAEAGLFAAQLLKPIRQQQLQAAIAAAIAGTRFEPGPPRRAPADERRLAERLPLRILVADDVEVNRRLTVALLRNFGYAASTVGTGREAVEAAVSGGYDLVLMDVQMPDLDGLEATRQIRARMGRSGPRIVALTASAMAGDRERCLAAGMEDYLAKPLQPQALRAALEQSGRGAARQAGRKRAARPSGAIDWSRIESLRPFDADGSMVAGAIAAFLADAPARIRAIREAHAAGDAAGLAAAAHALKGAAANIGAARLQELSLGIEALAREGRPQHAAKAIGGLEKSLAAARAALAKGKASPGS